MAEIAPSILSADFARLAEQVQAVEAAGVRLIHVDVMDGHFVPNISIGPPVVKSLRRATDLFLECHLMIAEPDRYAAAFAEAGAQRILVHQETCPHLHRSLQLIRDQGVGAGVVLNPATPALLIDEVLDLVDVVLVMSVNPGFGGQQFLPFTLNKVRALARRRADRNLDFLIEIDGGVSEDNAAQIVRAGCDILVAGSSIFGTEDPASAVKGLKDRMAEAHVMRA